MPGRNVFTVLEATAKQYGDAIALHQPVGSKTNPSYKTHSWKDWAQISREIGLGLRALGAAKGEIVCILSETRAEFYLVDLGIMGAGAVSGALYTAYPMPELARDVKRAEVRFLFIEDPKTLEKLSREMEAQSIKMPEHVILMTGDHSRVLSLEALRQLGRDYNEREPGAFDAIQRDISPDDPAILYLTSGATGEPKMGLTSHAAILANIDAAPVVLPTSAQDSIIAFLPSAHIAQRIVLQMVPIRMGTPVWFSESLARLPHELKTIRPTIFFAPPRVWERMYATILTEVKKKPAIARKIFHGALGLGMEAARYRQEGKPLPIWMRRMLKVADKLVFSKVRERLGGRIRIAASGAAPLGKELAEFFAAIGMPLIEGYGLTEAGVIAFNPLDRPKPGSIGVLMPNTEARLAEDGELRVRTRSMFKGYYRDEEATRSVLTEDGWFSTGDLAEVDEDGYWYITGRKKELIVSSNGKKIYPARIETLFKTEPIVNQILLIGDKKPYVTALLTVNAVQAQNLKNSEEIHKEIQAAVSRVNMQLADFERIRKFKILHRDFSIEQGELTPTMKIRRAKVLENHSALVSELYVARDNLE